MLYRVPTVKKLPALQRNELVWFNAQLLGRQICWELEVEFLGSGFISRASVFVRDI